MRRLSMVAAVLLTLAFSASTASAGTVYPAQGSQGTVILLHGMSSDSTMFDVEPYRSLREQLVWLGWNVITLDLPDSGDTTMADRLYTDMGGDPFGYRALWDEEFHHAVDIAKTLNPRVLVGGISWGGLHAILGACDDPRIAAWFVHAPVIKPSVLQEFAHLPDSPATNGMNCAATLADRPGLVSFGGSDDRVGVTLPAQFAARTGAETDYYPTLDHSTNQVVVDHLAEWVNRVGLAVPAR